MPNETSLGGTVIMTGGQIAVLHRIECDGRTTKWRWMTADEILR